jgi:hypothetical protein
VASAVHQCPTVETGALVAAIGPSSAWHQDGYEARQDLRCGLWYPRRSAVADIRERASDPCSARVIGASLEAPSGGRKVSDPRRTLGPNRRGIGDRVNCEWGRRGEPGELRHCERSGLAALLLALGGLPAARCADRRPDFALRYAQSLRPCAKDEWVDPGWADGGAVVDLDRRRLLFFGDELMVEMPERRAMMSVLAAVWSGYAICWAYDGNRRIGGICGGRVAAPPVGQAAKAATRPRPKRVVPSRLCYRHHGTTPDVAAWWHLSKAWHGPALMDKLPGRGVRRLTLGKIPEGGLHIDVPRKTVGAWQTADTMGIFQALPDLWSGWQTECWEDRYEEQVNRCKGALRVPDLDLTAGVDSAQAWIRNRVFQSFADSPAGQILKLATLLAPVGPGLEVNSDAVADCAVRPREAGWARFVDACNLLRTVHAESA